MEEMWKSGDPGVKWGESTEAEEERGQRAGSGNPDKHSHHYSGFYLGFVVWERSPEWPTAMSFLRGSGGMLPRNFF